MAEYIYGKRACLVPVVNMAKTQYLCGVERLQEVRKDECLFKE